MVVDFKLDTYDGYNSVWWEQPTGATEDHYELLYEPYGTDLSGIRTSKDGIQDEEMIYMEPLSSYYSLGDEEYIDYIKMVVYMTGYLLNEPSAPIDIYVDIYDDNLSEYLGQRTVTVSPGDITDEECIRELEWSGLFISGYSSDSLVGTFDDVNSFISGVEIDWFYLTGTIYQPPVVLWQGTIMGISTPQKFIGITGENIEKIMGI